MSKIRIGIVGAGDMALEHLKVLTHLKDFSVVGLTSRTQERAEKLLKQFRLNCFYPSLDVLVKSAKPQALVIVVSEESVLKVAGQAMDYGLPLFIEKPAGLTAEENLQLANKAKEKNIRTMVGYNRRYYSIFHKGLELVRSKGPLLGIAVEGHERIWRVRQIPKFSPKVLDHWIYANSTHTLDLLRFFGGEVAHLSVQNSRLRERQADQFVAAVKFRDGALGTYQSHWYSPGGWRVVLYGHGTTVEFRPLESGRWIDQDFQIHDITADQVDVNFKPGLYKQALAFADLVRTGQGQWPLVDLQSSYETMRLAQDLLKGGRS